MTSPAPTARSPADHAVRWPSIEPHDTFGDDGGVDCWAVDLSVVPADAVRLGQDVLSAPELDRAARFHREVDQAAFFASHTAMRMLLSRYIGVAPAAVPIHADPAGRPVLEGAAVHFNLSHSGSLALIAVSRVAPVGIDVEAVVPMPDAAAVARDHFSADEHRGLLGLGPEREGGDFFVVWTRKEAVVKALGLGVPFGFDRFSTGRPDMPPVLDLPGQSSAQWTLMDLAPAPGYRGAVATRQPQAWIRCRSAPWAWLVAQSSNPAS